MEQPDYKATIVANQRRGKVYVSVETVDSSRELKMKAGPLSVPVVLTLSGAKRLRAILDAGIKAIEAKPR